MTPDMVEGHEDAGRAHEFLASVAEARLTASKAAISRQSISSTQDEADFYRGARGRDSALNITRRHHRSVRSSTMTRRRR